MILIQLIIMTMNSLEMNQTNTRPPPLFMKGSMVKFKQTIRDRFRESRRVLQKAHPQENLGNLPVYNLMISEDPRWDNTLETYIYQYLKRTALM